MSININDGVSRSGVHLIQKDKIPPVIGTFGPVLVGSSFKGPGHIAANAGVVDLRCVINRVCPFTSSGLIDDVLIFNASTIKYYPSSMLAKLSAVPGTEGIFLKKEYVYRHNYIYATVDEDIDKLPSSIERAEQSLYKKEHEWEIKPTAFDKEQKVLAPSQYLSNAANAFDFESACDSQPAVWGYSKINKGNSTDPTDFTQEIQMPIQTASSTCAGAGVHWRLEKRTPLFKGEDFFIEFRRTSRSTDVNSGISPEVREARADAVNQLASEAAAEAAAAGLDDAAIGSTFEETQQSFENQEGLLWRDKEYASLDVQSSYNSSRDPINLGVVSYDEDGGVVDRESYDFRNQAYYVIELGYKDREHNYFIIITQRGKIRLVQMRDGKSRVISEYSGGFIDTNSPGQVFSVDGNQLIEADWFRMTFRNHLGQLVIEIEGSGFTAPPWIVTKTVFKENSEKNENKFESEIMTVSKSKIRLWGGNIQSGFIFGPLQYKNGIGLRENKNGPGIKLNFPPEPIEFAEQARRDLQESYEDNLKNSKGRNQEKNAEQAINNVQAQYGGISKDTKSKQEERAEYALPIKCNNLVLLTATDHSIEEPLDNDINSKETNGGTSPADKNDQFQSQQSSINKSKSKKKNNRMFTQDAQRFIDARGSLQVGSFYKQGVLKEESEILSLITAIRKNILIDDYERNETFKVEITMTAGNHVFEAGPGETPYVLNNCKTPIFTMMRLRAEPTSETRWDPKGFDCSQHVMSFNESWAAQDFTRIEHTGQIRFLLNEELPSAKTGPVVGLQFKENNDRTEELLSLRDKAFYIEVWAGYEPGPGLEFANGVSLLGGQQICNYSRLPGMFKLFTGICYGGTTTHEYGARFMDCQIFDYTQILKDQRFFNSPFYDGVKDINAVEEILSFAAFRSDKSDSPRFMLNKLSGDNGNELQSVIGPDGRMSFSKNYALPNAYAKLTQPFFKFKDGDSLYDGITQISTRAGKLFYFDSYGVARYENYNDIVVDTLTSGSNAKEKCESPIILSPLFWFTTNHNIYPGQLVFNNITIQESVSDVFNHVKLLTNTPDFTPIFADDFDYSSLDDPSSEGFIGYLKTLYQAEGSFGSMESAKEIMQFYKSFRRPPYVVRFESYGQPLRALDIIALNGQRLRVMRVTSDIDASKNVWWQQVECEWLKPIESSIDPGKARKEECNPQSTENEKEESFTASSGDLLTPSQISVNPSGN